MIEGILIFLIFLFGVSVGGYLQKRLALKAINIENDKLILSKKNDFLEVLKNLRLGNTKFKSRVNDTVYVSTTLTDQGEVDVIYMMDKSDIAIFKDSKCIHTSDFVDTEIIHEIVNTIFMVHNKQINDIVEILGFTFYREEFEKSFNINFEELKKSNIFGSAIQEISEIDKINTDNQNKFHIDEILDKISESGIASLTIEERLFLDNYSNEKRN
jgi:hypothetical protein